MAITDDELRKELKGFYVRLNKAKDKLAALPETADKPNERKKLFQKKQKLRSEIQHVRKLIKIGNESLSITQDVTSGSVKRFTKQMGGQMEKQLQLPFGDKQTVKESKVAAKQTANLTKQEFIKRGMDKFLDDWMQEQMEQINK
jgi:hypothetical protein